MDYTFLANVQTEFALPERGILSRVLHKDEHTSVTLLRFSAGEELSGYSSPTRAVLHLIEGEAEVQLGEGHGQRPGRVLRLHVLHAAARHLGQDSGPHVAGTDEGAGAITGARTTDASKQKDL